MTYLDDLLAAYDVGAPPDYGTSLAEQQRDLRKASTASLRGLQLAAIGHLLREQISGGCRVEDAADLLGTQAPDQLGQFLGPGGELFEPSERDLVERVQVEDLIEHASVAGDP